jgi:hypothetical protein
MADLVGIPTVECFANLSCSFVLAERVPTFLVCLALVYIYIYEYINACTTIYLGWDLTFVPLSKKMYYYISIKCLFVFSFFHMHAAGHHKLALI